MFVNIKKKLILLLILLTIAIIFGLNITTTQKIGINYKVFEYQIPLYLKLYNFYGRHINYKFQVNQIVKNTNSNNDLDKLLAITKWLRNNVQKIPSGVDVIDSHPFTIIERRLGVQDNFADALSVLLVYGGIDSFLWYQIKNKAITFFKINSSWSVIDPYYGVIFLNNNGKVATISEIHKKDWKIATLDLKPVDENSFISIFGNDFSNIKQAQEYYQEQFLLLPTQEIIDSKDNYALGGRAYIQSPFGRLKYEVNRFIKITN